MPVLVGMWQRESRPPAAPEHELRLLCLGFLGHGIVERAKSVGL